MPTLDADKSEHESPFAHALGADPGSGGDPPHGLHEWWNTPQSLYQKPVKVDPAIHGVDPSDFGHEPPRSLDAYVGMSNATAQAGTGAPALNRADHTKAAEGGRAATMDAQLTLAAKRIEAAIDQIDAALKAPIEERSADAVLDHMEGLIAKAVKERDRIMLVANEAGGTKLQVAAQRDGVLHVDRASHQLNDALQRVQQWAGQHKLTLNSNQKSEKGVTGVANDVVRAEGQLSVGQVDSSHVPKVPQSEDALRLEAIESSLDGLESGAEALVLAVNEAAKEPDPGQAMKSVLRGLASTHRLLQASLVDAPKVDKKRMTKLSAQVRRIKERLEKAVTDAAPFHLESDPGLTSAGRDIPMTLNQIAKLGK